VKDGDILTFPTGARDPRQPQVDPAAAVSLVAPFLAFILEMEHERGRLAALTELLKVNDSPEIRGDARASYERLCAFKKRLAPIHAAITGAPLKPTPAA
jgi:hypothetical protein